MTQCSPMIVAHGGVGAQSTYRDGCQAAVQAGMQQLAQGGDALQAAVAAVCVLEDDPRFNAGTGSVLRLDGATIEMDASVMDSTGRLGAVAGLQLVRHPVEVAAAVAGTPHWLLVGEGALRFARKMGASPYDATTPQARDKHQQLLGKLGGTEPLVHGRDNGEFLANWNYPAAAPDVTSPAPAQQAGAGSDKPGEPCDTVGAVVRDGAGRFAVAASTGGCSPALLSRVGDTPIIGAGFYAGPAAAVAVTGIGEQIVRHLLAFRVYQWIAEGMSVKAALERGLALFDPAVEVGLIAVSGTDSAAASNRDMPWAHAGS